jgi:hypothetical protein
MGRRARVRTLGGLGFSRFADGTGAAVLVDAWEMADQLCRSLLVKS